MHRRPTLLASGLLLAFVPAPAFAQSGGSAAPVAGGHAFEQPRSVPEAPRVRAARFTVTPGSVALGKPMRFAWRVDGPVRRVRARVVLVRSGGGRAVRVQLGSRRTGARATRTWTPKQGRVAPGRYTASLRVDGARLVRTARASGRLALEITAPAPPPPPPAPAPAPPAAGLFPVQGPYSLGGPDARFGAGRPGHSHQGQDITAASGTPVVTPVAGIVHWRAFQAAGAGHYLVVRGDDGRDYAFMHLLDGSLLVEKGRRVAAGQRLAAVGSTGRSSGPHLHFEIWPDGWYAKDSRPIDPLPDLLAWAGG